jgi:epsin
MNKNKYTGTGNDGMSFSSSSSSGGRYGGFGSDSLYSGSGSGSSGNYGGSYSGSGGRYDSGGGYGNDRSSYSGSGSGSGFRDSSDKRDFEEYDAGDDEDRDTTTTSSNSRSNVRSSTSISTSSTRAPPQRKATAPLPPPEPVKEVNLLDGFDDEPTPSTNTGTNKALPLVGNQNVMDGEWFPFFSVRLVLSFFFNRRRVCGFPSRTHYAYTRSYNDYRCPDFSDYCCSGNWWTKDEPEGDAQLDACISSAESE